MAFETISHMWPLRRNIEGPAHITILNVITDMIQSNVKLNRHLWYFHTFVLFPAQAQYPCITFHGQSQRLCFSGDSSHALKLFWSNIICKFLTNYVLVLTQQKPKLWCAYFQWRCAWIEELFLLANANVHWCCQWLQINGRWPHGMYFFIKIHKLSSVLIGIPAHK